MYNGQPWRPGEDRANSPECTSPWRRSRSAERARRKDVEHHLQEEMILRKHWEQAQLKGEAQLREEDRMIAMLQVQLAATALPLPSLEHVIGAEQPPKVDVAFAEMSAAQQLHAQFTAAVGIPESQGSKWAPEGEEGAYGIAPTATALYVPHFDHGRPSVSHQRPPITHPTVQQLQQAPVILHPPPLPQEQQHRIMNSGEQTGPILNAAAAGQQQHQDWEEEEEGLGGIHEHDEPEHYSQQPQKRNLVEHATKQTQTDQEMEQMGQCRPPPHSAAAAARYDLAAHAFVDCAAAGAPQQKKQPQPQPRPMKRMMPQAHQAHNPSAQSTGSPSAELDNAENNIKETETETVLKKSRKGQPRSPAQSKTAAQQQQQQQQQDRPVKRYAAEIALARPLALLLDSKRPWSKGYYVKRTDTPCFHDHLLAGTRPIELRPVGIRSVDKVIGLAVGAGDSDHPDFQWGGRADCLMYLGVTLTQEGRSEVMNSELISEANFPLSISGNRWREYNAEPGYLYEWGCKPGFGSPLRYTRFIFAARASLLRNDQFQQG